jgi:phenylacetate-CoA ligase
MLQSLKFAARSLYLQSIASRPPDETNRIARKRLHKLVAHARKNSVFWREKLAGINESSFKIGDLPTSTKHELMDNFEGALTVHDLRRADIERYFEKQSHLGKYFHGQYVVSHTSGSQGQPLIVVQPKENIELLFALQLSRGNSHPVSVGYAIKHLLRPARLAAVILKPGFYASSTAFAYMPAATRRFLKVLVISAVGDDLIGRLAEFRPTHVTAYSSMLHEIARAIEAGQLSLKPELEQVVNISERLIPDVREHYGKIFGAPVLDTYSMGECLFLTNGCSKTGGMHVNADWAIVEVVDENNQPVPPGEKGAKVLVTNLANYIQPFIRYEIGDIVTMASESCGCGSNMPLIECVQGRDSDVFYVETDKGRRSIQPGVFDLAIGRMLDAREYQLIQEDNARFRILIEPLPGKSFDRDRADKLMHEQLKKYDLDRQLDFKLEVVDHLTGENGEKFKRVVSKVNHRDVQRQNMARAS